MPPEDPRESSSPASLLEEIDRRQNQLLAELDDLNRRVEQAVQWGRQLQLQPAGESPAARTA